MGNGLLDLAITKELDDPTARPVGAEVCDEDLDGVIGADATEGRDDRVLYVRLRRFESGLQEPDVTGSGVLRDRS